MLVSTWVWVFLSVFVCVGVDVGIRFGVGVELDLGRRVNLGVVTHVMRVPILVRPFVDNGVFCNSKKLKTKSKDQKIKGSRR